MIVECERVHASDDAGPKGKPRGSLAGLDLALDAGVHAIVGSPEDGSIALAEILSGSKAPSRGRVKVGGAEPSKSAACRARIGYLGPSADLPDEASVRASMELAMRARGERSPRADPLLEPLGLAPLLARRPASLRYVEARAVDLALAITTPAPTLVALYEPLVDVAVQQLAVVRDRIRDLGRAGACVVVITSSPSDAVSIADRVFVLQRGVVIPSALGDAAAGAITPPGSIAEIVVWARDPDVGHAGVRELAAALASRPEVRAVMWEEHRGAGPGGSSLRVRSDDIEACSAAILEASIETGAIIDAIAPVTPGLASVRAAANALYARRYARPAPPPRRDPPPETPMPPLPPLVPDASAPSGAPPEVAPPANEPPQSPPAGAAEPEGDPR